MNWTRFSIKKKGKKVKVVVKCDSFFNFFRSLDPATEDEKNDDKKDDKKEDDEDEEGGIDEQLQNDLDDCD